MSWPIAAVAWEIERYGPFGRCIRQIRTNAYPDEGEGQCQEPACSDLGFCGDHLAELQAV